MKKADYKVEQKMKCRELVNLIIELLEKIENENFLNRIYISARDYVNEQKEKPE